ncbi:MAG: SDR family oxidoreductase [Kiloniellales bacterium]|nr:SDR family oxidoreductase [Kiloniellales bacterium]
MTASELPRHPDSYPRAALVTGGAQRIGLAICRSLAADGWALAVHHNRSEAAAQALVAEIEAAGGRATALAADLAEEAETADLVPRAVRALGPLGLLVNNAAVYESDRIGSATRANWDFHMEINLRAPFRLTQAFADALPEDAGGLVINILDERVLNLTPNFATYTLSKSGLWTLTRSLALALAPRIRINGIGPGYAMPERGQSQESFERAAAKMPLGRGTDPEEICTALQFLIAAKSVTGQMIALDGGQHLGWMVPGISSS